MSKRKQKGTGLLDMATDAIGLTSQQGRDKFDRALINGAISGATAIKNTYGQGKKKQNGGNFFGDAVDWTKTAASDTNDFLKNTKIISKGANIVGTVSGALPHPVAQSISQGAKVVEMGANAVGWGKKKKPKKSKKLKKVVVYIYK